MYSKFALFLYLKSYFKKTIFNSFVLWFRGVYFPMFSHLWKKNLEYLSLIEIFLEKLISPRDA